jgi:diguanylate cyclase (GGDEF)-like protein
MAGLPLLALLAAGAAFLMWRHTRLLSAELAGAKLRAEAERASRTFADTQIRRAKRQLQTVADTAPFLIAFLDQNYIFRFANHAHVLWFQRPLDLIVGQPMHALVDGPTSADYLEAMSAALATNSPQTIFHERSWLGRLKFVELTFVVQLDESGRLEGYWLTARDAPEAVLREQTLFLAARRDPLTGLSNRVAFTESLEQALRAADAQGGLLTVAFLDIDHFAQVNDRLGKEVGDRFLKEFGVRIKAVLRPGDTVARLVGDEIALIMRLKAPDDVRIVGARLLTSVREPFLIDEHRIQVTASIGFALAVPGDSVSKLLKRANEALHQVKDGGRDGMAQAEIPSAPVPSMQDLTCE